MDNVVKAEDLSIFPPAACDMRTLPRIAPQVLQLKYNSYLNDSSVPTDLTLNPSNSQPKVNLDFV